MRVCLFTPTFLPSLGGAEVAADRILRGLAGRGHDVQVLCQDHGDPRDVPYPVTRYRRPPAQHLWPERLSRHIIALHRKQPFDAMLAFYGYPTGFAAARVKRRLGFGLVVSARGVDLYPHFHALSKPRVQATIRAGYRGADRIVTLSQWLDDRLRDVAGPDLPPLDRVLNGIDLQALDADLQAVASMASPFRGSIDSSFDLVPGKFLLHLARVGAVKRQDLAIEAIHRLAESFRTQGLRYAFVGDGAAMAEMKSRVADLKLGDVACFLGRQTGTAKHWLLRHARGFISTSREEGMPNAVVEAIASGLPVLVSDIGPHQELLAMTQAGWSFRYPDVEDLTQQLSRLITQDLTEYRQAARACRRLFSLDTMIDGYERSLTAACDSTAPLPTT